MFRQLALLPAAGLLGPLLAAGRRPLAPDRLNLRDLVTDVSALVLAPAMALSAVGIHLLGAAVAGREQRLQTGLLASAQLGLPTAAAALGLAEHSLSPAIAAALVAGGVLTLFPATVGGRLLVNHPAHVDATR
jgi:Kef-type K+ transport system membrane component KefB